MEMISAIRNAMVQPGKQPLQLRENQIIQGKITKIYPNNKAEIQIGHHKLVAQITTPLSVGKGYFFQVQAADQIQLKVLKEQHSAATLTKMDVEALLSELGLKSTKLHTTLISQLIQEKVPFNQEQLTQAFHLLAGASDKAEAIEIVKQMIAQKLPITEQVFQSLQMTRQETMSHLLQAMYTELRQLTAPSGEEQNLMKQLEMLLNRPTSNQQPVFLQQMATNITQSASALHALKALGIVNLAVSEQQWSNIVTSSQADNAQAFLSAVEKNTVASVSINNNSRIQSMSAQLTSIVHFPDEPLQREALRQAVQVIIENEEALIRTAQRIHLMFPGLSTASLSPEESNQVQQMIEKELFPLLPKESIQMIQQALQQASGKEAKQENIQQILFQSLHLFSQSDTFQALATMVGTNRESAEDQPLLAPPPLSEQFMSHLRTYLQSIGIQDEYDVKMNLDDPAQLAEMKNNPSIKALLLQMVGGHEQALGNHAQALVHFINGMQVQTITEINNLMQASFLLPGDKLTLNKDVFMQFEGKKDQTGKIDADFCRILFVLDLANIEETMIDMHVQKRIISVNVYNEQEEPKIFHMLKPLLKESLGKIDYQLSTVQWKPLYENVLSEESLTTQNDYTKEQGIEGYDFLI